jgi:hypothetical protein
MVSQRFAFPRYRKRYAHAILQGLKSAIRSIIKS